MMVYNVRTTMDHRSLGFFTSLEVIDKALEGKSYLGRPLFRDNYTIYREQGTFGIPIADIFSAPLDQWTDEIE